MEAPTPPKAMSSRLLTMKFMQRAAASAPSSPAPSPKSEEQSSKRRKISHEATSNAAPVDFMVNQQAVQAAIDEGEKKREEAIVKQAAELGDARWVLDIPDSPSSLGYQVKAPLNVVQVGYAHIDSPDDTEHDTGSLGDSLDKGHLFRRYNMDKKDKKKVATESSDSNASSDEDDQESASNSDSSEDDGPARRSYGGTKSPGTPRPELQTKRSAEREKARELAEKRRKKEVKLNSAKSRPGGAGLVSISSGGGISSGSRQGQPGAGSPSFKCHSCGKPGHSFKSCPNKRR